MAAGVSSGVLRLPHFIIAGAPRSATTWLYELADRHPSIAMARPVTPEPKFFLVDERYKRGLPYYSQTWFGPLPHGKTYGEKTTNYLESPEACSRIALHLPNVLLVFLLRDPVERAYSNYLWSVRNGHETEPFERALGLEAAREREVAPELRYARPHAYFSRGLYARLLLPWFDRFSREQILVLRSEDVAEAPQETARALFRFVGVEERADLADDLGRVNTARAEGGPQIDPQVRAILAECYREPNSELESLLGPSFPGWG